MLIKCYNKTYNKALRDGNLKGLLITTNCKELAMTAINNTLNIERGQSRKNPLFYGFCTNSKRRHKTVANGRINPAYRVWKNMITRCYCSKYQKNNTTYIGCTVASEWLDFQDFADWFENQEFHQQGYQLDKDLLVPKNRVYSSDTCCLLPAEINIMIVEKRSNQGLYPQGVYFEKSTNKYKAQARVDGSYKHLGRFDCPDEAHQAYKIAKELYVKEKALEWQDRIADNVFQALMNWTLNS